MKEVKNDRRVKYTQKVIKESLLTILKKKPVTQVTVSEICLLADINRGTFYTHYYDAYSLLESIEQDLWKKVEAAIFNLKIGNSSAFLETIMQVIYDNQDTCIVIFGENGDNLFIKKIIELARNHNREIWKLKNPQLTEVTLDYLFTFMATGSIGVLQEWIKGGFEQNPKQLAVMLETFSMKGFKTILN